MPYKYSTRSEAEHAKAAGVGLPISTKKSIEVCSHIRGKKVQRAKTILRNAMAEKEAIPFRRFNGDVGHKRKIGPGRYAVKTAKHILEVIESAEANARFKGLNADSLVIKHISAQKGPGQWHYGRKRRRKQKNTHIEVIVVETEKKAAKPVKKKEAVKEEKKEVAQAPKKEIQAPAKTQEAKQ